MSAAGPAGELSGKRVVLGVCGGIAAYKAVEICRRLTDAGALVSPVLTRGATRFVGELTFSALADEPVRTSLLGPGSPEPSPHTSLARRADAVLVAPATARFLGSYAAGIASDLLVATLLATRAPVLVCPAMHTEMWEHPAVRDNVATLRRRGTWVMEPDEGRLAGGDMGRGRLPEPAAVVAELARLLGRGESAPGRPGVGAENLTSPGAALAGRAGQAVLALAGIRALVTAGGTREPLDPVRYLGNRSSGKQGYAIAAELAARGAHVTLVTASEVPPPEGMAALERVATASEMAAAVHAAADAAHIVVMAAAVADYTAQSPAATKIKKSPGPMVLTLVPTEDILAELGRRRRPGQVLVGFAAETASGDRLVALGRAKLEAKGADLIVANDVGGPEAGFGQDLSSAVIVSRGQVVELGLVDKRVLATRLVDMAAQLLPASGRS